jgi:membrane-bound ClpP family serine protease
MPADVLEDFSTAGFKMEMETVGYILAVLVLVEFFHIGYLVAAIRKNSKSQTIMLRIALGIASGQGSIVGKIGTAQGYMDRTKPKGSVLIDGEIWDCRATGQVYNMSEVRVTGFAGPVLIVEKAT